MSHSPEIDGSTERSLRSSTRNPRRRQRQTDPESVKTAPRRKRSKISENTFVPPRHDEVDEEAIEEEVKVNGSIEVGTVDGDTPIESTRRSKGRPRNESFLAMEMDIPLRSKRTGVRRPRADGSTTLTQTERYSVKLLPSTPKDLRKPGIEWRGSIGTGHLAFAVTRTRAYIWDYTVHSPVTNPKTFELPFTAKSTDALPLAALISSGASTETGLVIVSAGTGKVVFYESVERAASLGVFQDRAVGVEGSLGSLFSGETVSDIISVHHAGFILPLTSGRIAHLTLRDTQGNARIFSQFLRATDSNSGGFFGSIKGLLGAGAWNRDVAAVRTRQGGPRGQMQVISLTEKAELQAWDLEWSGQYTYKGTVNFREAMTQELKKLDPPELESKYDHLVALDFAILDGSQLQSNEVTTPGSGRPLHILILLQAGRTADDCEHVIAGVMLEGEEVVVHQLQKLPAYQQGSDHRSGTKPRLLLPASGHTAVAVFPDAMIVKELDQTNANSPGEQLQDSLGQPTTFEDAVYLKKDRALTIVESCEDSDKSGNGSVMAFVNGAGLIRLTIAKPQLGDEERQIPLKTKIEQAVFHGALQDSNILDFSRISDGLYSTEEVREAALCVSDEVLRSTSPFISTAPTSMESHLAYKGHALRALVTHVRHSFPALSNETMWALLWDAERVGAAQQLWQTFEAQVAACDQEERISVAMYDVCKLMQDEVDGTTGENSSDDPVHAFFIHKLHELEKLLTVTQTFLKDLKGNTETTTATKLRMVREGDDIWIRGMGAVFDFRTENASTYGILSQSIENGILVDAAEYVGLEQPWTSTTPMLKAIIKLAELSRQIANEEFEKVAHDAESPLASLIGIIGAQNPRLIEIMCAIYQENINWTASQPSEKQQELAERLRESFNVTRHNHIRELADIAQAEAGIRLAEKYRDMSTLTEMVVAEMQFSIDSLLGAPGHEKAVIHEYTAALTEKVSGYFKRFGDAWATAYFDEGFSSKHAGVLLRDAQLKWQPSLTKYLRADRSRAKICWINDITSEKDFTHAFQSLTAAAIGQATKIWEKKVELSLSKLALLAVQEESNAMDRPVDASDIPHVIPDSELALLGIQTQLYQHLLPEIRHCIDHQAEVEVAMQKFGFKNQDLHALKQLLESYLDRVLDLMVLSADELIDVLTLLDNVMSDEGDVYNLQGSEFFIALKVLHAVSYRIPTDRFDMLLRLIWKRCYVYDDWHDINNGQKQSTEDDKWKDTAAYHTIWYCLESDYFDSPGTQVRFLAPSECLGAGCRPEDLTYRWPDPDLLDPILMDNKIQDEQLQSFVDDRRLDDWIETCKDDVRKVMKEKASSEAGRFKLEKSFESSGPGAEVNEKINGHLLNGTVNGAAHDESDLLTADKDGDVDMDH